MFRLFLFAESTLRMENILYAFWAMFWGLNGLDKFFNGVLTETDYGTVSMGWFGVNRDDKMIHYFDRLSLPDWLALGTLYGLAVAELFIAALFVYILFKRTVPAFLQRLAFKLSMLVFFLFSTGDILFGDRTELWEHGTFMILALVSFKLFLLTPDIRAGVVGKRLQEFDIDGDGNLCEVEYEAYLEKMRAEHGHA